MRTVLLIGDCIITFLLFKIVQGSEADHKYNDMLIENCTKTNLYMNKHRKHIIYDCSKSIDIINE